MADVKSLLIRTLERWDLLEGCFAIRRIVRDRRSNFVARLRLRFIKNQIGRLPDGYCYVNTRSSWHVAELRADGRVEQLRIQNFEQMVALLDAEGVEYFVVPSRSAFRTTIGVHVAYRETVLGLLMVEPGEINRYVSSDSDSRDRQIRSVETAKWCNSNTQAGCIGTYSVIAAPNCIRGIGYDYRCDLEFWSTELPVPSRRDRGPTLSDAVPMPDDELTSPKSNPVGGSSSYERLRSSLVSINGVDHPTAPEFSWYFAGTKQPFPIDIVYTWVNGADPAWQSRQREAISGGSSASTDGASEHRFRSFDELRYSLRSVYQFVPFVRNIYIVTDRQHPEFLDLDDERIKVVDHVDIFEDKSVLPTFNSHAIETQLHHVEGLADHYLYMNDDVFFGRMASWSTYFDRFGGTKFFESRAGFGIGESGEHLNSVDNAGKNLQRLLLGVGACAPVRKIKHTPHAQQRDLQVELERTFPEAYDVTMRARVRSTTDVSFAAALHHRYGEVVGRAQPGTISYKYLNLAEPNIGDLLRNLHTSPHDTLCLNDGDILDDRREVVAEAVGAFLKAQYPYPAPWEIDQPLVGRCSED